MTEVLGDEIRAVLFDYNDTLVDSSRKPWTLFPGTIQTLQALRERDIKIGVVTDCPGYVLYPDLERLGLKSLIDYTQEREKTEHGKPHPKVFEPALEWLTGLDITPGQVTYVGDSIRDYEAAKAAGFGFVGVESGFDVWRFRELGDEIISIESLARLVKSD